MDGCVKGADAGVFRIPLRNYLQHTILAYKVLYLKYGIVCNEEQKNASTRNLGHNEQHALRIGFGLYIEYFLLCNQDKCS